MKKCIFLFCVIFFCIAKADEEKKNRSILDHKIRKALLARAEMEEARDDVLYDIKHGGLSARRYDAATFEDPNTLFNQRLTYINLKIKNYKEIKAARIELLKSRVKHWEKVLDGSGEIFKNHFEQLKQKYSPEIRLKKELAGQEELFLLELDQKIKRMRELEIRQFYDSID